MNKDFCDFQDRPQSATLQDSDANEVHLGEDMTVYDMEGNPHTFTPHLNVCSHFPGTLSNIYSLFQIHSDHALLSAFYDCVEESYVTDKEKLVPLHVKKDPHSVSDQITQEDFYDMSTREVQERLRRRHIIITGVSHRRLEFNERGFSTLEKTMDALILIQSHISLIVSIYLS